MSKTKFIKVPVSERLPDESRDYQTNEGQMFYNPVMKEFEDDDFNPVKIEYWLSEVPDREDEMRDALLKVVGASNWGHKIPDWLLNDIENLLKTQK